tara:strand:+ start:1062 stop:1667 length:606 start_codon:yes stop_codon:yes gene_type:complete
MNNLRQEKKIIFENKQLNYLYLFLKKNNFKKIYPDRNIYSIYYDTPSLKLFQDSEEGVTPRSKIRVRAYSKHFFVDKTYLEEKISLDHCRKKTSKLLKNKKFLKRIFNSKHGYLYPKVAISYKRSYYSDERFRITLDRNLKYSSVKSFNNLFNINFIDKLNSLEIKYDNVIPYYIFQKKFPFKTTRFSKYCNAISALHKFL